MTSLQTLQFKMFMSLSIFKTYSMISMVLQYTDDVINKCKHYIFLYMFLWFFISSWKKLVEMPKRCAAFNCSGNYAGEPYCRIVHFPIELHDRERWIAAMPNAPGTLHSKDIYICASHFTCKWVAARGAKAFRINK